MAWATRLPPKGRVIRTYKAGGLPKPEMKTLGETTIA
jgi:hypothetical protein